MKEPFAANPVRYTSRNCPVFSVRGVVTVGYLSRRINGHIFEIVLLMAIYWKIYHSMLVTVLEFARRPLTNMLKRKHKN